MTTCPGPAQEFRQMYKEKKLPLFDVIFTYSSVEHSGLGEYYKKCPFPPPKKKRFFYIQKC